MSLSHITDNKSLEISKLISVVLICLSSYFLPAQSIPVDESPYFVNYSYKDGLPSNESYFVLQDSKKRIWIATDNGVGLMSGGRIKSFTIADGLIENVVLEIYEDRYGRIWFLGLGDKLCYYKSGKIVPYKYNYLLESKIPYHNASERSIAIDEDGTLYLGYRFAGMFSIDKDGKLTSINKGSEDLSITTIGDKRIWSIRRRTFGDVSPDKIYIDTKIASDLQLTGPRPIREKLLIDNTSSYLTHQSRIISIEDAKIIHVGKDIISISSFTDKIYVGTRLNGFYILEPNSDLSQETERYLKNYSVTGIQVDHQGGIWCTTLEKGLFYCSEFNLKKIDLGVEPMSEVISSVRMINETIYLGFRANKWISITQGRVDVHELLGDTEMFFGRIGNDYIRAASDGVVSKKFVLPKIGAADFYEDDSSTVFGYSYVYRVFQDSKPELLYDYKARHGAKNDATINTIISNGSLVWVGNRNGVFRLENMIYSSLPCNEQLTNSNIIDLERHKDLGMLIATDNMGIVVADKNGHYKAGLTKKLTSIGNCIQSLHTTKDDQLFVASNKGIYRVIVENGEPIILRLSSNRSVRAKEVSMLRYRDDKLYIGTKSGLYTLSGISKIKARKNGGELHYAGLSFPTGSSQELDTAKTVQLDHTRNSFTVHFYSSDYRSDPIFKYRMNKGDTWIEITDNFLPIQNIESGEYEIEICQFLSSGQWSEPYRLVSISISKPIWQNAWFIISIVLASIFLIVIIIREMRISHLKKSRKLMLAEHSALKAQMKPHFIFNSLNSIQRLILFNQNDTALEYLSRFSGLSRRLLSSSKSGVHTLKEEVDFISNYLSLESLRYKEKFEWEVVANFTDEELAMLTPNMMVQPFIENSIQHAFKNDEGSNKIEVKLEIRAKKLVVKIIDNGVGRKSTSELKKVDHDSYGIQIVRGRLKLLCTKSNKFALSIGNLSSDIPVGTQVEIELPLLK